MSDADRIRWDRRYADRAPMSPDDVGLPTPLAPFADLFPTAGLALDVACGSGSAAVWLARRGMSVQGCDVSGVAIAHARSLAERAGVAARCRFDVVDLDGGLPPGPPVNVLICSRFRAPDLDGAIIQRLAPGALLAVGVLSEVGAEPGPFRAAAGELERAFGALDVITAAEGDGQAWLLARR
ncbi:class I SAM-dependent methyltransferase [Mycobacterium sp. Y57]|uniref:class I SAM-dependent methyltransferase n=1 Tax=Mycolicibacterium xanthum TaxID=2796469 RepID=UPI001C857268|nr:class I SAM-dependent methyltransferase [Mycolicibacterium xanthum]MBX7434469.1 class I SAM-dependent methyltransferase [Mycolicibacterium xanthum]